MPGRRCAHFGPAFLWTERWSPAKDIFGAAAPIYGTLVTSLIAMVIGVPISFGIAIFLTELCPALLRRPIGIADRAAGRHPLDHLRALGLLRAGAVPAAHMSSPS